MKTRILTKHETRRKTLELIEREIQKNYPRMHPVQRKILARKSVKEVLKKCHGQKMILTTMPASRWQKLKLKYFPKWVLRKFPVQYVEI